MTVWAVLATGKIAEDNYSKTLTQPINAVRRADAAPFLEGEGDQLYAWGFPANPKSFDRIDRMREGDICFFFCNVRGGNSPGYQLAARVRRVFSEEEAPIVSKAFWDSPDFLPFLLDKPVSMNVEPELFGRSLNPNESYMRNEIYGSQPIANVKKASPALDTFGSFEEWALDFIESHATEKLSDAIQYEMGFGQASSSIKRSNASLLKAPKKTKGSQSGKGGGRNSYSPKAKKTGDIGERCILDYLAENLSAEQAKTLKWVANEGEKPGYDIEYLNEEGEKIGVEVKATSAEMFESFQITANELECAKKMGENYHLYFVAHCLAPAKRVFNVVTDPAKVFEGRFVTSVYKFV